MMPPTSRFRLESRTTIARVMASVPADASHHDVIRALEQEYPFPRALQPGPAITVRAQQRRAWNVEVQAALGRRHDANDTSITYHASDQLWLTVRCGWCHGQRLENRTGRCMMCARYWEAVFNVAQSEQFLAFRHAANGEPGEPLHRLALADWLADNGYDAIADAVRKMVWAKSVKSLRVKRRRQTT